ncbi:hypothetical protein COU61_01560 [Candidatus Pacearchaeota archaeon CG10_big_fil_rev_8_21_14_0_10_35_13]|nr:MAG: hypothetical protein COU61_01560 [Candidatus Pacearchaeota archaeon CG10_big_fil_rev_8_21_14_0_10_35_13]
MPKHDDSADDSEFSSVVVKRDISLVDTSKINEQLIIDNTISELSLKFDKLLLITKSDSSSDSEGSSYDDIDRSEKGPLIKRINDYVNYRLEEAEHNNYDFGDVKALLTDINNSDLSNASLEVVDDLRDRIRSFNPWFVSKYVKLRDKELSLKNSDKDLKGFLEEFGL